MGMITGRYSGNPETAFDLDIRQLDAQGLEKYVNAVIEAQLSEGFWTTLLPQQMETSSAISPYFLVYKAAQVKLNDKGFLSRDVAVRDLILNRLDVHHIYPKHYLKTEHGLNRGKYNQIANFVLIQSEINIAIGEKAPQIYFNDLIKQCNGEEIKYGGITSYDHLRENMRQNAIPEVLINNNAPDYDEFLSLRRSLMAAKIREYFELL
jgi:hypothetical protein